MTGILIASLSLFAIGGMIAAGLALRRAETLRRESLQTIARHRALLDQLPHFVFSIDTQDRYTAMNAAACRFFGRPESDILGKTAIELGIDPEHARMWTEQNAKTRRTGETRTLDSTAVFDGRVHSFRAITSPLRNRSGAIVGVTGVSIDMTELRTAEAIAHRLLHAVEQLDEIVFITDRDGRITYVNAAFERAYGYSSSEAIGQTPRILNGGEFPSEHYASLWSELLAGRSVRMEFRNRRKNGELVDITSSASPLCDESGICGFIAVQQDATELKRAAEDRRRLDERMEQLARMEALGTLAGGIAHDFNNILAIILTHTTVIERRHDDPTLLARSTETLRQAVRRGAVLARQLLTFANRADMTPDAVDLHHLMADLGLMITEMMPRTIEVRINVAPDLPRVHADAGQLHQSLLNLCTNARDAMPEGGTLTIDLRRESSALMKARFPDANGDDYVVVSVSDTGAGITDDIRKHIFEPFFSTKPRGKGTGLGLALVFGVVHKHGGLIDVDTNVGKGTTFRLYLPLAREVASTLTE